MTIPRSYLAGDEYPEYLFIHALKRKPFSFKVTCLCVGRSTTAKSFLASFAECFVTVTLREETQK